MGTRGTRIVTTGRKGFFGTDIDREQVELVPADKTGFRNSPFRDIVIW